MDGERLSDKRYITVILHLVVDSQGELIHGEAVEVQSKRTVRFRGWPSLPARIRALLNPQPPDQPAQR